MSCFRLLACICCGLLPGAASPAALMRARVMPNLHRVHLTNGEVIEGTVIFSGRRGLMLALRDRDLFIPADGFRRIERRGRGKQDATADIDAQAMASDSAKTFQVVRKAGSYVLRDSGAQAAAETGKPKADAGAPATAPPRPIAPSAEPPTTTGKGKPDLAKAAKLLARARALLASGRTAKQAADADRLRRQALPLLRDAEAIYHRALKHAPGDKKLEQALQGVMRDLYRATKMTRTGGAGRAGRRIDAPTPQRAK